ncbi:hypothetical protein FCZ54_27605, partial [Escherichia coli]|nr:hypothetical protein [Escherichia coli]
NSPSRYFSDTTFLNSNENFSMHPQFLVWCLTFGAQFTYLVDTTLSNSSDSDQTVQAVRLPLFYPC